MSVHYELPAAARTRLHAWLAHADAQDGGEDQGSEEGDNSSDGSDGDDYDSDESGELETGDEASDAEETAGRST